MKKYAAISFFNILLKSLPIKNNKYKEDYTKKKFIILTDGACAGWKKGM